MGEERTILHCDCNAFFASVATLSRPELANVPMAVCGNPEKRHGIILAKNELAKRAGVTTGETLWQARQKAPNLVTVPPEHEKYAAYSARINELYLSFTDLVEPFGIDESWLDVTGSLRLFGDGKTIADRLRREVREQFGLTISVGVSFHKALAKLGSDYKKPDATTVISRENLRTIVYPLPVSALLFVGAQTAKRLAAMHVRTIGDLAAANRELLVHTIGKLGGQLWDYANGTGDTPVASWYSEREVKSVGRGMTFSHDLVSADELYTGILYLADDVARRLRRRKKCAAGLQLTIKNPALQSVQRQCMLQTPTDLARDISAAAMQLFLEVWQVGRPVRMLTITALHLVEPGQGAVQLDLFSEPDADWERREKMERTLDEIRTKYGKTAIGSGAFLGSEIGIGALTDDTDEGDDEHV